MAGYSRLTMPYLPLVTLNTLLLSCYSWMNIDNRIMKQAYIIA